MLFKSKQKDHQNRTSDGLHSRLWKSYLTAINPKRYAVKSQFITNLMGWIK